MSDMSNTSEQETGPLSVDEAVQRLRKPADSEAETEASQEQAAPEAEADTAPEEGEDEREEAVEDEGEQESEAEDSEEPEDEDEESESEAESEEDEDPSDQEFEVQGEKVKLDDLKKGYLRQSDYTRKTQELAQERQQLHDSYAQARDRYEQVVTQMLQGMPQEQEPDWNKLYQEDPTEYAIQRERWRHRQEEKQKLMSEQQRIAQERQAEQQQKVQQTLQSEFEKLKEKVPELADPKKGKQEINKIKEFVKDSYGFTDQDFDGLTDHRAILLIRDAMKGRQMDGKKNVAANKVKDKPKVMSPGSKSRQVSQDAQKRKSLRNRVRSTGKIDDAAKYLVRSK